MSRAARRAWPWASSSCRSARWPCRCGRCLRFTLELDVSQRPSNHGEAIAIVAAYRFGEPIQLKPGDVAGSSVALTKRTRALVAFVTGMRADSQGYFDDAQTAYSQAEALLPD